MGTMDEAQFYDEADSANGTCFKSILRAWTGAGGATKWGAGGVGLRGVIAGKEVGLCFLAPAYAGKKDRIELSLTPLSKRIGARRCDALSRNLREVAGDRLKGQSMVSIVDPGGLPASARRALTSTLCELIR